MQEHGPERLFFSLMKKAVVGPNYMLKAFRQPSCATDPTDQLIQRACAENESYAFKVTAQWLMIRINPR
jgi:hypothetical protein